MRSGADLDTLKSGGKPAVAQALSLIESGWRSEPAIRLLDEAYAAGSGYVVGVTGPPGVGKSSLASALLKAFRARSETVAVLAVDPSSQSTRGALLGDRLRIAPDPDDSGAFVRSMAARDRLGGLSEHAFAASVLLRALYDWVIVETVGVGQSEADVRLASDALVLCIQPGSGDSLQFMKAGIMETPDIVVVTKADLGIAASRAKAEVEAALRLSAETTAGTTRVILLSTLTREGLEPLMSRLAGFRNASDGLDEQRARRAAAWLRAQIAIEFGRAGLAAADRCRVFDQPKNPFATEAKAFLTLSQHRCRHPE